MDDNILRVELWVYCQFFFFFFVYTPSSILPWVYGSFYMQTLMQYICYLIAN